MPAHLFERVYMCITTPIDNGCISHWTEAAKYCYKIKCNCKKCVVLKYYPSLRGKCKMKNAVLLLYRKYGAPDFSEYQK